MSEDELNRLREAFERQHTDTVAAIAASAEELATAKARVAELEGRVAELETELAELRNAGLLRRLRRGGS